MCGFRPCFHHHCGPCGPHHGPCGPHHGPCGPHHGPCGPRPFGPHHGGCCGMPNPFAGGCCGGCGCGHNPSFIEGFMGGCCGSERAAWGSFAAGAITGFTSALFGNCW